MTIFCNANLLHFSQHLRDQSTENIFNAVDGQKIPIKMMKAQGYFKNGNIDKYNSEAIEFPYDVSFNFFLIRISHLFFNFSLKKCFYSASISEYSLFNACGCSARRRWITEIN